MSLLGFMSVEIDDFFERQLAVTRRVLPEHCVAVGALLRLGDVPTCPLRIEVVALGALVLLLQVDAARGYVSLRPFHLVRGLVVAQIRDSLSRGQVGLREELSHA